MELSPELVHQVFALRPTWIKNFLPSCGGGAKKCCAPKRQSPIGARRYRKLFDSGESVFILMLHRRAEAEIREAAIWSVADPKTSIDGSCKRCVTHWKLSRQIRSDIQIWKRLQTMSSAAWWFRAFHT
jgi:hypothetical protein